MNIIVEGLLRALAGYLLGSGILEKFERHVNEQADKAISGAEKKAGVKAAMEKEGLLFAERAFNLGIELATQLLTLKGK